MKSKTTIMKENKKDKIRAIIDILIWFAFNPKLYVLKSINSYELKKVLKMCTLWETRAKETLKLYEK